MALSVDIIRYRVRVPHLGQGQAIADHLAEFPIEDRTPINPNFPDEGILQVDDEGEKPGWKMYFDGAVNSTGSGIGAVLISPDGCYYPVAAKIDFPCTNNVAEYEKLTENFEDISFTYTPRMTNQFADSLATLASMVSITKENLIEPLEIERAEGPAHCNSIEASEAKPWYEDIKNLLQTGQYPPFADRRDRKTLRCLAIHYFLSGEILYCRSFDSTLLWCIDEHESRRLMEEVHGGNCGPHMNVYADQIKASPNELRPMTAPWPFSMWGMDVIGPIKPKASNGHMFILVAIDYFTKWIEAITLASVTAKAMARFLRHDVIARYGVPATIITDNAKNLNNKAVLPIEVEIPSMRILAETELEEAEWARQRVRHRDFNPGDLVLRKVLHVTPDSRGKFSYKYDGPFVVKEVFSGGVVILSTMDGTENALPVNANVIKKYYP
ncbi:hypothetical protein CRG98_019979 [Punica granatum]|uniref:Integrase catalytic domain-containing protein n=1 Tax=Punica granatum TaxID=22663 RepID=A0A2I0JTQ5_PUNGR|nr:hypothetical protein CRG98_019979 [Punica granatum]